MISPSKSVYQGRFKPSGMTCRLGKRDQTEVERFPSRNLTEMMLNAQPGLAEGEHGSADLAPRHFARNGRAGAADAIHRHGGAFATNEQAWHHMLAGC